MKNIKGGLTYVLNLLYVLNVLYLKATVLVNKMASRMLNCFLIHAHRKTLGSAT